MRVCVFVCVVVCVCVLVCEGGVNVYSGSVDKSPGIDCVLQIGHTCVYSDLSEACVRNSRILTALT